jgi:hypothetical protein
MNFSKGDYEIAMGKLYRAKWNVPQAAEKLGLAANEENWELVKVMFREYCLDFGNIPDSNLP